LESLEPGCVNTYFTSTWRSILIKAPKSYPGIFEQRRAGMGADAAGFQNSLSPQFAWEEGKRHNF